MDETTSQIVVLLGRKPNQSARDLSKQLGRLRKDVNSRLYSQLGSVFLKEGSDPPLWRLNHQHLAGMSGDTQVTVSPSEVMSRSGLEMRRHLSDQDLTALAAKLLGSSEIQFNANGIKIEVSLAEQSLSDPYFAFEMGDPESMQVVINTTVIPRSLLQDKEYLFSHLVHCVADAFVFRQIEKLVSPLDREDLYQLKSQILLQLGFDSRRDPFQ